MQNILFPLTLSTLAGLSTLVGAIFILFKIKESSINKFITFCLAFSLSVMIFISIFDLIPISFFEIAKVYGMGKGILLLTIVFIISYMVITLTSKNIDKKTKNIDLYKVGILNMIILIMHNLPEGIATFLSSYHSTNLGIKLSIAIMLHNIPEGIAIAIPIYYATGKQKKAIYMTLVSGLSEPIGALLAFLFLERYVSNVMISIVLIIVASLMITLSIQEILPKALKYKQNKYIYIGLLFGFILVIINILIS